MTDTQRNVSKNLIKKLKEDLRWQRIYKRGAEAATKYKITSEEDIDIIISGKDNYFYG